MAHNLTAGEVQVGLPKEENDQNQIFSVMHAQNQSTENVFVTICLFHRFSFLRGKTGIEIHR